MKYRATEIDEGEEGVLAVPEKVLRDTQTKM